MYSLSLNGLAAAQDKKKSDQGSKVAPTSHNKVQLQKRKKNAHQSDDDEVATKMDSEGEQYSMPKKHKTGEAMPLRRTGNYCQFVIDLKNPY